MCGNAYCWLEGGTIRREIVRRADNVCARRRRRRVLDLADLYGIDGRAVVAESLGAVGNMKPDRAVERGVIEFLLENAVLVNRQLERRLPGVLRGTGASGYCQQSEHYQAYYRYGQVVPFHFRPPEPLSSGEVEQSLNVRVSHPATWQPATVAYKHAHTAILASILTQQQHACQENCTTNSVSCSQLDPAA